MGVALFSFSLFNTISRLFQSSKMLKVFAKNLQQITAKCWVQPWSFPSGWKTKQFNPSLTRICWHKMFLLALKVSQHNETRPDSSPFMKSCCGDHCWAHWNAHRLPTYPWWNPVCLSQKLFFSGCQWVYDLTILVGVQIAPWVKCPACRACLGTIRRQHKNAMVLSHRFSPQQWLLHSSHYWYTPGHRTQQMQNITDCLRHLHTSAIPRWSFSYPATSNVVGGVDRQKDFCCGRKPRFPLKKWQFSNRNKKDLSEGDRGRAVAGFQEVN